MKKHWLLYVLLLLCILSGCSSENNLTKNQEVFYNPYIQKVIVYDEGSKTVSLFDNTKNQFQFKVDGCDDLFVDGNSMQNEFRIIRANQLETVELYSFNKSEGVFPVGIIGEKLYFIHSYYDKNGLEDIEKRCISVFDMDTSKIQNFSKTSGLIDYGGVNADYIYYSVYNDSDDAYTMMRVKTADINAVPEIVCESLTDGVVMVENDKLFYTDDQYIISDQDSKYKKEAVNMIYKGLLIQFYVDQEGLLCIKITNLETKKVFEENEIYGIRFEEDNLLICTATEVINYELCD